MDIYTKPKPGNSGRQSWTFPKTQAKVDTGRTMSALRWLERKTVEVASVNVPVITEATDAIVCITTSAICGSDLHIYHNEFPGMQEGDILGHEGVGIVEAVGPEVKRHKPGDRVVISAIIACGECYYCQNSFYSCCDRTNSSKEMQEMYGHRTAGIFGHSHCSGGYSGLQAEYARVPLADVNCFNVSHSRLPDSQLIFLSDILCAAWHANELGEVKPGETVAIWGCGPLGLASLIVAKSRGAAKVICIDVISYRLEGRSFKALELGAAVVIDSSQENVLERLQEIVDNGPDVCIDAVGFRFPRELKHRLMRAIHLETDSPEVLRECLMSVRKAGKVSVVGDYYWVTNMFPIGALMQKGIQMRGGLSFAAKYWKQLLEKLENGELDMSPLVSHELPLSDAPEAYRLSDKRADNVLKVILHPHQHHTA